NKFAAILLACCATVCSLGVVQASAVNLHDEATMTEEEKQIKEYCDIIVNCVNNERTERGLSELAIYPELSEAAYVRAVELVDKFDHYRPNGDMCFTALKENGIRYSSCAENLAGGRADPVSTVDQWMNSEGHRKNILGNYTHIGIGYYYDPNSDWVYNWSMFLIGLYDTESKEPFVFDGQYCPTRELGDVDGSHVINSLDAKKILKYAASRAAGVEMGVVHEFMDVADLNGDGIADARDASAILAYSAAVGSDGNAVLQDFIW
ncbi:MAG: hypothetical protein K2G25_09715, partial [Oscillospiraceae bacterium]|nr:hypothetical protein [Oscillospiraceae bacterium]